MTGKRIGYVDRGTPKSGGRYARLVLLESLCLREARGGGWAWAALSRRGPGVRFKVHARSMTFTPSDSSSFFCSEA